MTPIFCYFFNEFDYFLNTKLELKGYNLRFYTKLKEPK